MMVKWAYDGLLQANSNKILFNDGEVLVNNGEMLVNDGEMSVEWSLSDWVINDHTLILPSLTSITHH